MTELHTAFHPRISSPHAHKGTDRVGAPFLGKSVCAAMSWLTGMAGGRIEKEKSLYVCTERKLWDISSNYFG